MMLGIRDGITESVKKGNNASLFGMETSGHNRTGEEIVNSLNYFYKAYIDPRLFSKYSEDLVKHYLFTSLKGLNNESEVGKYQSFDDFAYTPESQKKLVILFKNTELALAHYPKIFEFLRGITRYKRGTCAVVFTGNHHAIREDAISNMNSEIFLGNIFINLPYNNLKGRDIFMDYLISKEWVDNKLVDYMLTLCGGNPNIIQGVARYFNSCRSKPLDLSTDSLIRKNEVRVRLNQIYKSFNSEELNILKKLLLNYQVELGESSFQILKKVGVVTKDGKIFSKLLEKYLLTKVLSENKKIDIKYGKLFVNGNKEDVFSNKEMAILRAVVDEDGRIIAKEKLFDLVWQGNYEKYSDWNLDQLIRRIRKKLAKYKLEDKLLTVKGKGYLWYTMD